MKKSYNVKKNASGNQSSLLATHVPMYTVTYHTAQGSTSEQHNVASGSRTPAHMNPVTPVAQGTEDPEPPFATPELEPEDKPLYETTAGFNTHMRKNVAHMNKLKAQQQVFLDALLSLHHNTSLLAQCARGIVGHLRRVRCNDCLQADITCKQCWMDKHRTMPTHWALVWDDKERFFIKTDFSRMMKNSVIALRHYGVRCHRASPSRLFTLVDTNGIHATTICFCGCTAPDSRISSNSFALESSPCQVPVPDRNPMEVRNTPEE
ncbi:hypothetical protein DFH08DRAFT_953227 [Mycena albidolilacea]|uniref:CxC2-like cysteine cluster KDZ transposase-associated domain-containing protein n=1 Tax=Mycena albidolilacea TaxID=1033008 RepID=A0AAD7AGB8_9AGAR|nr:hypothetical protein DFH08DRAFT_953227 [Mycena albidolilacea]